MSLPAKFPRTPILCYVTDRKRLSPAPDGNVQPLLERIAAAAAARIGWIQIREKDLCGREVSQLVREALLLVERSSQTNRSTSILVNDRVDVALAEKAGGVHLGEHSLPIKSVSQWVGQRAKTSGSQEFLMGVSCHSLAAAMEAERDGADYIFFGPIFSTPAKAAFGAPQGLDRLSEVCSAVSLPVLAIGGVTQENAASCLAAGAAGLAAIRLFQDCGDLPALTTALSALRRG